MKNLTAVLRRPNKEAAKVYAELYALYRRLHDQFGGVGKPEALGDVMKRLLEIKEKAKS